MISPLRVAIVGRPNVGKSTLFNRLAGKRLAIVDDTPGVTRDWREAEGAIFDQPLRLIDTAGLEESFDESIESRMRRQTELALAHADLILFVVDGRSGLTPMDAHFADWLRRQKKPVILIVNKCESDAAANAGIAEAWSLGLGDPVALSSAHGVGMEDLYNALIPYFPKAAEEGEEAGKFSNGEEEAGAADFDLEEIEGDEEFDFAAHLSPSQAAEAQDDPEKPVKIAIVGRPNVGKSTLLNAIVNDQRVMTGPEAGITRDAIAVDWEYAGRRFKLVDTAGLRRKAKIEQKLEKMAAEDTLRAIRLAQIVILVLDGQAMFEKQDLQIARHVIEEGRALVVAVNKWDAVRDRGDALEALKDRMSISLAQIRDLPFVTVSALNGKNIGRLLDQALSVYDVWQRRVPTARLNRWLRDMASAHPPPMASGRPNKLRYMAQINTRPPTFALWCGQPDALADSYKRYLINGLREDFDLPGVPVRLLLRTSKNPFADGKKR